MEKIFRILFRRNIIQKEKKLNKKKFLFTHLYKEEMVTYFFVCVCDDFNK